jgi:hypothetical protein
MAMVRIILLMVYDRRKWIVVIDGFGQGNMQASLHEPEARSRKNTTGPAPINPGLP